MSSPRRTRDGDIPDKTRAIHDLRFPLPPRYCARAATVDALVARHAQPMTTREESENRFARRPVGGGGRGGPGKSGWGGVRTPVNRRKSSGRSRLERGARRRVDGRGINEASVISTGCSRPELRHGLIFGATVQPRSRVLRAARNTFSPARRPNDAATHGSARWSPRKSHRRVETPTRRMIEPTPLRTGEHPRSTRVTRETPAPADTRALRR